MPVVGAASRARDNGLVPFEEWQSQKRDDAKERDDDELDYESLLTPNEVEQFKIIRYCANLYDEARKARAPFETFDVCWDLFIGNVWPQKWPSWRAKITINKIRAFITFMQSIMTDNKPRISVEPLVPGSEDAADLLRKLVDRDWDENDMQQKLSTFVLFGLIWGTGFMKITYDPFADSGRGRHVAEVVPTYRIFTNRTAKTIEDAEYVIHVEDVTLGWIRRNFPAKADTVRAMRGVRTGANRERDRDYVREGDLSETARIVTAQNVDGNIVGPMTSAPNPLYQEGDGDEIEVCEYWLRDDTLEPYERQKMVNGEAKWEPDLHDDGSYKLQVTGRKLGVSEIDGATFAYNTYEPKKKPVMETAWRPKFPNGRVVLIAGGRVLLRDIPSPFQTDGFPFAMWKDYDVGAFWGQGEPIALKDCSVALNKIISQVYDILEKTGNPQYKLKKGAGVNYRKITNKPGLLIPMDEMDGLQPLDKPQIPAQFFELFGTIRTAMGEICGVNDSVQGTLPAANTAFATMDQLQESGAAPIRLKVRNVETGITRIGKLRTQLIQQYDNGQRPIRYTEETKAEPDNSEGNVVQPAANVAQKFKTYKRKDLQGQVEFGIVPISSLSTSPAGTWNRWMTMLDKHLIDDVWWHGKFRVEGWRTELPRMKAEQKKAAVDGAALKALSKAKPGPKGRPGQPARRPGPRSNVPTRESNAAMR